MIRALVVFMVVVAPLLFFVAYCRSLLAWSLSLELSEQARRAMGLQNGTSCAEDFFWLQALARLCPIRRKDEPPLAAVCAYYHLLAVLQTVSSPLFHVLADWADRERRNCFHFAAVILDRRIAQTRKLWADQMIHREK
ncbi:MAG: hypothetical protein ACYDDI_16895 [Candidatus Acidiferrales bacterium]